jgi:predicted aspartyl protease
VRIAIDSGATWTTIEPRLLRFLGYDTVQAAPSVHVATANGMIRAPQISVRAIAALGLVRKNMSILALALPSTAGVDGLLGLDFLRGLRVTLDFRDGRLIIE